MPPHPNAKLFSAIVATQIAAVFMCAQGWLVPALPWSIIGWVWVYNLVWMVIQDIVKLGLYRRLEAGRTGRAFLGLRHPLDAHAGLHQHARTPHSLNANRVGKHRCKIS